MKGNRIKLIMSFILVICLSLFHVHCSINTQDNPLNPLTLILMLIATSCNGNIIYEIAAFYSVQFIVTAIIASFILNFRNIKFWLLSYTFTLIICICIGTNYWNILDSLINHNISKLYEDFYGYGDAFVIGAIGMFLQILALTTYISLIHIYNISKRQIDRFNF